MPTINFTDSQYEALLSILGYVAGEEKDLQEKYDLPENFEQVSNAKKIHMIHKVGATGHIYREILLLTMAIDGEEEEEEDNESVHTDDENLCAYCKESASQYCDKLEEWFCDEHLAYKGCGNCESCKAMEFCEEHEQVMWKDGMKCSGCLDVGAPVIIDGVEDKDFLRECIEAVFANKNK